VLPTDADDVAQPLILDVHRVQRLRPELSLKGMMSLPP
jgi:hypothetical protein